MMVTNYVWTAYAFKVWNMDLIIINTLGALIASSFVYLYLYVKYKVARLTTLLPRLIIGLIFAFTVSSSLTDPWMNGLIATMCSVSQYIFILESVKGVLQTKDPERVDLIIAVACIFNSLAWGIYAKLVGDIFVFIPNVCAFAAGWINISLYLWTIGNLEDSSLPIKILHKCCNKQARILPKKVKDEAEIENEGLFFTKEPEDANSHGVVLREHKKEKDDDDD